MKAIGITTTILFMMLVSMFISGWAITSLWAWFIVPLGVMVISYPHALGISAFISFFKIGLAGEKHENNAISDIFGRWLGTQATVALVVGFGWIFQNFM